MAEYERVVENVATKAEEAIKEFAKPDPELGWIGAGQVDRHASEIAAFLDERGLLREPVVTRKEA